MKTDTKEQQMEQVKMPHLRLMRIGITGINSLRRFSRTLLNLRPVHFESISRRHFNVVQIMICVTDSVENIVVTSMTVVSFFNNFFQRLLSQSC